MTTLTNSVPTVPPPGTLFRHDVVKTRDDCVRELTKSGAAFELCSATVDGVKVRDYVYRPKNLAEIASGLSQYNDRTSLVYGDRRISYASLAKNICDVASSLQKDCGVKNGDRVAILAANSPEWIISFWAIVSSATVCTALNGWWKADEIVFALRESGTKILIADCARFKRIANRLSELPDLQSVYLFEGTGREQLLADHRVHRYEKLIRTEATTLKPKAIGEDEAAVIIYTSGTTGHPKGAVITHRAWITGLMNMAFATETAMSMYPDIDNRPAPAVILCTLPFFHVAGAHGLVFGAMAGGATLIMPEGKFEPATAMLLIEKERVTRWSAVPTMVWRFCTDPDLGRFDLSSVMDIGYGGSPSSIRHQELARKTFPGLKAISNAYGLTESGSVFAMITGAEFEKRPDSVGQPFLTAEIRIVDNAGLTQASCVRGEILVKGPFLMRGYWMQTAESKLPVRDGWLHTGDIGYLDEEGFLYVTDRRKDIIIRGGENIASAETENRILEHPDVSEVAVIGVKHLELGEEVKAFVRLNDGADVSAQEIQQWVSKKLADFKVPTLIEIREKPLPRNALGKLLKNELRDG